MASSTQNPQECCPDPETRDAESIFEFTRRLGICVGKFTALPPVKREAPWPTHKIRLYRETDEGSGLRGGSWIEVGFTLWDATSETPKPWQVLEWIGLEVALVRSVENSEEFCADLGFPEARGKAAFDCYNYYVARALAVERFLGENASQWLLCREAAAPTTREV